MALTTSVASSSQGTLNRIDVSRRKSNIRISLRRRSDLAVITSSRVFESANGQKGVAYLKGLGRYDIAVGICRKGGGGMSWMDAGQFIPY